MNMNNVNAIFQKDLKDFMANMSLLVLPILPIVIAWLYNQTVETAGEVSMPIEMIYTIIAMAFAAVMFMSIATMFAEENEKHTLRGLLQSPASIIDIIVGKVIVSLFITLVSLAIALFIVDGYEILKPIDYLGMFLFMIIITFMGVAVGLAAKSVGTVSAYSLPVMFGLVFSPMINNFVEEGHVLRTIVDYLPVNAMVNLHNEITWQPILVLFGWIVAMAILALIVISRAKKDD